MLRDEVYDETVGYKALDYEGMVKAEVTAARARKLIHVAVKSGVFAAFVGPKSLVAFFLGDADGPKPALALEWICEALREKHGFDVDKDAAEGIRIGWAKKEAP